ncbi:MAG: leucine-rich repeat protein [Ruminococcus sp.]|nr:leucine-rich repeat protein [Ruminococcus sp.]
MLKKTISIILAALMLASILSVTAFAADVKTSPSERAMKEPDAAGLLGENGSWKFYEDEGELYIYGDGEMADTYSAFRKDYRTKIKSVIIADGVTSVSAQAFMNCTNLESVGMGMSAVTEIGTNAFYGCTSLSLVSFPDKLISIGEAAFMNTALQSVYLPDTIANIGNKSLGYKNASTKTEDFEIEGYGDTVAYTYAQSNGFKFTQAGSSEPIEGINLNYTEPQVGETPSTAITASDEIEVESFIWFNDNAIETMSSTDTFEEETLYVAEIYVKAKSGNTFKLNEKSETVLELFSVNGNSNVADWSIGPIEGMNPEKYAVIKVRYELEPQISPVPYPKTLNLTSGKLKLSDSEFSDVRNCFRYADMYGDINMVGSSYDLDKNGKADVVLSAAEAGGPFVKRASTCNLKGKYTFKISNYEYSSLTVNFGTPSISAKTAALNAGATKTLSVTGASVTKWTTSGKTVATVTNGKVTALKKGTVTITATLATGGKLTCKVTVKTNPKLSKSSVNVKVKKTVNVSITGKAPTVNNVYTNTKIAKITSKNTATTIVVKGLKKGTTTLKVKVNGVVLNLKVTVK